MNFKSLGLRCLYNRGPYRLPRPSFRVAKYTSRVLFIKMESKKPSSEKYLLVFSPGEAARNLPRWQFGLNENGSAGATITYPLPNVTWRYARKKHVEIKLTPNEVEDLMRGAQAALSEFPEDCLKQDDLWADASEKANSITRDRRTNSRCVSFLMSEGGVILFSYSISEKNPILAKLKFYQIITRALGPDLNGIG